MSMPHRLGEKKRYHYASNPNMRRPSYTRGTHPHGASVPGMAVNPSIVPKTSPGAGSAPTSASASASASTAATVLSTSASRPSRYDPNSSWKGGGSGVAKHQGSGRPASRYNPDASTPSPVKTHSSDGLVSGSRWSGSSTNLSSGLSRYNPQPSPSYNSYYGGQYGRHRPRSVDSSESTASTDGRDLAYPQSSGSGNVYHPRGSKWRDGSATAIEHDGYLSASSSGTNLKQHWRSSNALNDTYSHKTFGYQSSHHPSYHPVSTRFSHYGKPAGEGRGQGLVIDEGYEIPKTTKNFDNQHSLGASLINSVPQTTRRTEHQVASEHKRINLRHPGDSEGERDERDEEDVLQKRETKNKADAEPVPKTVSETAPAIATAPQRADGAVPFKPQEVAGQENKSNYQESVNPQPPREPQYEPKVIKSVETPGNAEKTDQVSVADAAAAAASSTSAAPSATPPAVPSPSPAVKIENQGITDKPQPNHEPHGPAKSEESAADNVKDLLCKESHIPSKNILHPANGYSEPLKPIESCIFPMTEPETRLWELKNQHRQSIIAKQRFLLKKPIKSLQEYPFVTQNLLVHTQATRTVLLNAISKLKHYEYLRKLQLKGDFLRFEKDWEAGCQELDRISDGVRREEREERKKREAKDRQLQEEKEKQVQEQPSRSAGGSRRRNRADFVDDAEIENVLLQIDPDYKHHQQAATIPAMVIGPVEKYSVRFKDVNNLVTDKDGWAKRVLEDGVDTFTETEHQLFVEGYLSYPKRFGKISQYMGGLRTPEECVLHYYKTKRTVNYKQLIVERNRRRKSSAYRRRKEKEKEKWRERERENAGEEEQEGEKVEGEKVDSSTGGDVVEDTGENMHENAGESMSENAGESMREDTSESMHNNAREDEVHPEPQTKQSFGPETKDEKASMAANHSFEHDHARGDLVQDADTREDHSQDKPHGTAMKQVEIKLGNNSKPAVVDEDVTDEESTDRKQPVAVAAAHTRPQLGEVGPESKKRKLQEIEEATNELPNLQLIAPANERLVQGSLGRPSAVNATQESQQFQLAQEPLHHATGYKKRAKENDSHHKSSYWSVRESNAFPGLLEQYGSQWAVISEKLGTKSTTMVRNYFQRNAAKKGWQELVDRVNAARALQEQGQGAAEQQSSKDGVPPQQQPAVGFFAQRQNTSTLGTPIHPSRPDLRENFSQQSTPVQGLPRQFLPSIQIPGSSTDSDTNEKKLPSPSDLASGHANSGSQHGIGLQSSASVQPSVHFAANASRLPSASPPPLLPRSSSRRSSIKSLLNDEERLREHDATHANGDRNPLVLPPLKALSPSPLQLQPQPQTVNVIVQELQSSAFSSTTPSPVTAGQQKPNFLSSLLNPEGKKQQEPSARAAPLQPYAQPLPPRSLNFASDPLAALAAVASAPEALESLLPASKSDEPNRALHQAE